MVLSKNGAIGKYAVIILADRIGADRQYIELVLFAKTKLAAEELFEGYRKTARRFNDKNENVDYAPFILKTKELIEDLIDDCEKDRSHSQSYVEFFVGMCDAMYGDFSTQKRHNPVKYDKIVPGKKTRSLDILQKKWPRYKEDLF